ncbi:TPA: 3-phosphoshikimate 1-carboxyvinyltransferase, partial [Campylobacter coli]
KSKLINAKELRVKESDRIAATVENLKLCGVNAKELEDGFEIEGSQIKKAKIKSYGDHRIAMSFAILGLLCGMEIDESECIKTSFPNFMDILTKIGARIDY